MCARRHLRTWALILAVATVALLASSNVGAQAWLPPKGEGWISFGYGNVFTTKHYLGVIDPGEFDGGHMRGQALGLQLGYGVTDQFTLSVGIPFVFNRYYCVPPYSPETCTAHPFSNADDGSYHATFQDFRVNARLPTIQPERFPSRPSQRPSFPATTTCTLRTRLPART